MTDPDHPHGPTVDDGRSWDVPHFYFHVSNSLGSVRDEEGRTLPDLAGAREKAKQDIRSMLSEEVKRGILDLRGRVEIVDAFGNVALVIPFRDAVQLRLVDAEAPVAEGPRESP